MRHARKLCHIGAERQKCNITVRHRMADFLESVKLGGDSFAVQKLFFDVPLQFLRGITLYFDRWEMPHSRQKCLNLGVLLRYRKRLRRVQQQSVSVRIEEDQRRQGDPFRGTFNALRRNEVD